MTRQMMSNKRTKKTYWKKITITTTIVAPITITIAIPSQTIPMIQKPKNVNNEQQQDDQRNNEQYED